MVAEQDRWRRRCLIVMPALLLLGVWLVSSAQPAGAHPSGYKGGMLYQPRTDTPTPTHTRTPTHTLTPTHTPTNTRTPTATPTPCAYSGMIAGAITTSDPTLVGRHNRDSVRSTCVAPKACPVLIDTSRRHYDAYTFTNTTSAAACYTVSLYAGSCVDTRYLFSAAYLNSFNSSLLCANYLADIGISPNPWGWYSFNVPSGATFVVVVYEIDAGLGCPGYNLSVTSCEACHHQFTDMPPSNPFYDGTRCLACRNIISGYADGTFRPNAEVTRGQLSKIVSNAAGFEEDPGAQIYQDVPPTHVFYAWINRLTRRGHMGGYQCGGPGEPCVNNRPYFRPAAPATRGQTAKIVASAAGFTEPPVGQTFQDVPPSHPFYEWIQRLASRGIMGGYQCGGPGEPCVNNRPYFRPSNNVTRGQSAKIVANAFYPNCRTP